MGGKFQGDAFGSSHLTHNRARFNTDHVIGSPFFLATLSLAVIGWFIAFISSIAADAQDNNFSHFAWWAIIYQLFVIIGVAVQVLFGTIENYKLATCAFLASALSFTTSTCNALIYSGRSSYQAAAAGHIFLSIVNIVWILYFGSTNEAMPHAWIDSYSLSKGPAVPGGPRPASNAIYPTSKYGSPYPRTNVENAQSSINGMTSPLAATSPPIARDTPSVIPTDLQYNYRAKAIYSYEANAEDPNEISFNKGEVLEVADISGKWFQAKNAKGDVGIAPSNYLNLIPLDS